MTKQTKTRYGIIVKIIKNNGIEFGGHVFMSLWCLANDINNTWNAKYFVNQNKFKSASSHGYALDWWRTNELFRAIRHTCKNTGLDLRKSYNNGSEYIVI